MFFCHPKPQLKRCHSEPQLKECHVLKPYLEPRLKGYVPSHNLRNTSKSTFEVSLKPCRPRTLKQATCFCLTKITWRCTRVTRRNRPLVRLGGTRTARRQAPLKSLCLQVSPNGCDEFKLLPSNNI